MVNPVMIRVVIFVLIALATLFSIISIAGNYWYGSNLDHGGLWRICGSFGCHKIGKPDGEFKKLFFFTVIPFTRKH